MRQDANVEEYVSSDMMRLMRRPAKSKKGGTKGSVALLKESAQLGCVSQDSYPKIVQGYVAPNNNSGKKGSIAKNYPKSVNPMSVLVTRQNSKTDHMRRHCARRMRPQSSVGFGEHIYKLKNAAKLSLKLPLKQG